MTNNELPAQGLYDHEIEQLKKAGYQIQSILAVLTKELEQKQLDPSGFKHHSHIPEVVSSYRLEHKMHKGDLALLAGITPNTLSKLNKDHTNMRVDTLLAILESLGQTIYIGPMDG